MDELDLKYRPRRFAEVVGNAAVVKLLLTRSKMGTLAGRSMMFGGPKGCGKTSLARITARAIVCDELAEGEPCGECESCRSITDESSTSFDEYDAATQGTVDRVRSLVADLDYGSLDGKPRVVILDEAHRLSKPSQDALLKSMEDRRLVIILCTTEPKKIVDAIRSRTEEYPISPPVDAVILPLLERICSSENLPYDAEALRVVAKSLGNCPRECICALSTLRDSGGVTLDNAHQLFRYDRMKLTVDCLTIVDRNPQEAFAILDTLSPEGATWIRDTMVAAIAGLMRQAAGARSNFPVPVAFFEWRGIGWAKLAQVLGALDKPTMADIEAALLGTMQAPPAGWIPTVSLPSVWTASPPTLPEGLAQIQGALSSSAIITPSPPPPSPPPPSPPPPSVLPAVAPKPLAAPSVPKARTLEVEGVKFTSNESLTSLDSKIEKGSGPPTAPENVSARVECDQRHVPLPEKEFANGLIRRVKGG